MSSRNPFLISVAVCFLVSSTLACSVFSRVANPNSESEPGQPVIQEEVSTEIPTSEPTNTTEPSPTPDVAATQFYEALNGRVSNYYGKGYLPSTSGKYVPIDDFSEDWAQIGWYNWWNYDVVATNFMFSAHFKWSTATSTPDVSGCGVVFAIQENKDHYAVFLDRSRILFMVSNQIYSASREVGTTRGTGRVSYENPAEANFALFVNGDKAYVEVDNQFIGEYSLSKDTRKTGSFGLTVLSGTNRDYGTRCEMTDAHLWVSE